VSITKANVLLLLLGTASLVVYRTGLKANGTENISWFIKLALGQAAIYLAAACLVFHTRSSRSTLLLVIVFAILFRLSIVFSPPQLSDDIYRYIWDGRVQAAGINPYRYVPAAEELAHLRDTTIYPRINRRDYANTIYPPVAEALFFLTTRLSESVTWMKLTMLGFELVAAWVIAQLLVSFGLPPQRLVMYAWHPLIVWEFAGSGHVEAIAIAFITLALLAHRRQVNVAAGAVLACATLVKLFPLVLFPAVYKRWSWKMPFAFALTIILAYLCYLSVGPMAVLGFLPGYAQEQGLVNGEQFYLLSLVRIILGPNVPATAFLIFVVIAMGAIAIWALRTDDKPEGIIIGPVILATTTTVLFAPHYSWYFAWLVPFLCFKPHVSLLYLTIASFALYLTWLGDSPAQMFRINSFIYLPFVLIAGVELWVRHRKSHRASNQVRTTRMSDSLEGTKR
jgi:hypothetical protein